ncbi:MAG: hypothetical protein Q4F41_05335 [Eubacteriales bacterium]|nr:hypothetical protein [Eubacteriales bacterium]
MRKEWKICLPFYKVAYSVFCVAILSVIRGVFFSYEVGAALEPVMGLLAAVFCADTYVQEITSRRSEVERLYPMKNRMRSIFRRMLIQESYLLLLAVLGYGLFYLFQRPMPLSEMEPEAQGEMELFLAYLGAILVTLVFWGMLAHTLACLGRSLWVGIGCSFLIWIAADSTFGANILGKWNLFSYTFRNVEDSGDWSWLCGKLLCIAVCAGLAAVLPKIIQKRGS